MSDTGDCPLTGTFEECHKRLKALEESLGMLLERTDTDEKILRQLGNQISVVRSQVEELTRLGVLVEAADKRSQRLLKSFGKVEELLEHTLTQIGNGRGGK